MDKDKDRLSGSNLDSTSPSQPQEISSSQAHTPEKEQSVASVAVSHNGTGPDAVTGSESAALETKKQPYSLSRVFRYLMWTPRRCRYDPKDPPKFGWGLNLIFALVGIGHL